MFTNAKYHNTQGIVLKVLSLFIFAVISVLISITQENILQSFFLVSGFALLFQIPWLLTSKGRHLKVKHLNRYAYRALVGVIGMFAWCEALQSIQLNIVITISYITPIFLCILASIFCGERLVKESFLAVIIGFIGISIIMSPISLTEGTSYGAVCAIFAAFMWSCHDIICKIQTETEHYLTQSFYTFLFVFLFISPLGIMYWEPINTSSISVYAFVSLLAVINTIVLFLAYKFAPINLLMPFSYLKIFFIITASYLLLGEDLSRKTLIGTLVILSMTIYIIVQYRKGKIVP